MRSWFVVKLLRARYWSKAECCRGQIWTNECGWQGQKLASGNGLERELELSGQAKECNLSQTIEKNERVEREREREREREVESFGKNAKMGDLKSWNEGVSS